MNYVIWSIEHDAWWGPARIGYTRAIAEAGVYGEWEAREIVKRANGAGISPDRPDGFQFHECMIPVAVLGGLIEEGATR
jgi:hypothetical protein